MSKKKTIIVLCSMVALLVLTGCLNYFLNRPNTDKVDAGNTNEYTDYFTSSHTDRDTARTETVGYYNAIIESEASSADAKANAEAELAALVSRMETEQRLETLIKALGFNDCLVTVGENINVIIRSDALTDQEVAQILDVVISETGSTAMNVRIKPIEA